MGLIELFLTPSLPHWNRTHNIIGNSVNETDVHESYKITIINYDTFPDNYKIVTEFGTNRYLILIYMDNLLFEVG